MNSESKSIAIVAVGAALAGAAVGATIVARARSGASKKLASAPASSSSSPFPLLPAAALSCVVFISDGGAEGGDDEGATSSSSSSRGFNVKVARKVSFWELRDAVVGASAGRLDGRSRLFVAVEGAYRELAPENARSLLAFAAASGGGGKAAKLKPGEGDSLIVLAATRDGADLSPEAASRAPPTPVPRGPRGLPFLGNALAFTGPHEVPGMNLYRNLFDPKTVRGRWGDTIRISLPVSSAAAAALEAEAGVVDESRSVNETIVTSDPEILAELCAREADFPKMWNRPAQIKLQDFTGNGIFTSSSTSSDWIVSFGCVYGGVEVFFFYGKEKLTPFLCLSSLSLSLSLSLSPHTHAHTFLPDGTRQRTDSSRAPSTPSSSTRCTPPSSTPAAALSAPCARRWSRPAGAARASTTSPIY